MLERQYVLSDQHCLHLLATFPLTRVPIKPSSVAGTPFHSVAGSCHHSIIPKLFFPLVIHWWFRSFPRCYAYLQSSVPVQFPPQIGVGGDLALWSLSFIVQIFDCVLYGPHSCLKITWCVESSWLRYLRNIYTLLVFFHPNDLLSHLCTIVGCTVSKNVP